MVTTTARQRILALIGRRGAASAAQLGRALNMSPAAVRHHLAIMRRDGRVVQEGSEPSRGRGRPEKIYRLSDRLLGENFAGLSDAVLTTWLGDLPASRRTEAVRLLGRRLAQDLGGIDSGLAASKRLIQLIEKLNELNYRAGWEAGPRGPHILLGHCPYAAIIGRHPELCSVDAAFLAVLAGRPVEQLSKIDARPGGPTRCVFAVQE
jgi:predicted ArsR family transcriptional regulator